jgi:hypothetical protein
MIKHFWPFLTAPLFRHRRKLSIQLDGQAFLALSVIPPWKKTWGYDTLGLFCHTMKVNQTQR